MEKEKPIMGLDFSGKIVWILVFAGVMVLWTMFGQEQYLAWVDYFNINLGEIEKMYLGYLIPGFITLIVVAVLIRSFRSKGD